MMSKMSLDECLRPSEDTEVSLERLSVLHLLQETAAALQCDAGAIHPPSLIRPVLEEALRANRSRCRHHPWTFEAPVRGDLVKQLLAK